VCTELQIPLWLEQGAEIKMRSGVQRGKNDRVDSIKIATYGKRYQDRANLYEIADETLQKLKYLNSERELLVKDRGKYSGQIMDQKEFCPSEVYKKKAARLRKLTTQLNKAIIEIENEMMSLINANMNLKGQFEKLVSVTGVGKQVALETIIATMGFKVFTDPRKYCCHVGVAPFSYSSGSSRRSASKVSNVANKQLKTLYHLASMSAIRAKGELQEYYERKVKEGKSKMSVLNAIRAKIIHRMFAVVRDNRKYEKNYTPILV
jgi:transposase